MISTQTLKGNLVLQDYTTAFTLNQGDKGVPFKIELLENGTSYTLLSTDTVSIEWLKPNGKPFLQDGDIIYGTNYIEIITPEAVAQYSGSGTFNIIISDGTVRKGTIRREYKVIPTSMKPDSVSEDVLTDAITELRELNSTLTSTIQTGNLDNYAKKTYVNKEVELINSSLEEKANESYVNGIDSRLTVQENKKISETDITESLLAQITGTTPISATVADYSIGNRKFSIPVMLGIKSKNLFDLTDIVVGKYILNTTGAENTNASYASSNFIAVTPGENIRISGTKEQGAFYDENKDYISGYVYANEVTTVPVGCYYIRLSMKATEINAVQLEYGTTATEYTSYNPKLDLDCINERIPLSKLDINILSGVPGVNLFNKEDIITDKYIDYTSGLEKPLSGYCVSNYIEVDGGETYYLSGTREQGAFYDENKNYISGYLRGNELYTSTVPSNAKYIRMTLKEEEADYVQLQKGELTPYEEYGNKLPEGSFSYNTINYLYDKLVDNKRVITVKKDGTGDYTSFASAVKSILYSSKAYRYEIQVYTGEYDIITELGGDTFLATVETNTSANQGLTLPNYVDVVGIGNVVLKGEIADDKATVNNTTRVSTLNYNKTNRIKNIKVTAKNMRYAIHSETNGTIENADIEMENVQSIHLGNTNSSHWKWCCGFGMGFGGNGKYKFKNCLFETKSEIYGNGGFICHNWNNQSSGSILDFECCEFTNTTTGDIGFRYGSMDNTYTDIFNFKGCQFNGKLKIKEESTGAGINASFYGYGNSEITTDIAGGLTPTVRLL